MDVALIPTAAFLCPAKSELGAMFDKYFCPSQSNQVTVHMRHASGLRPYSTPATVKLHEQLGPHKFAASSLSDL